MSSVTPNNRTSKAASDLQSGSLSMSKIGRLMVHSERLYSPVVDSASGG